MKNPQQGKRSYQSCSYKIFRNVKEISPNDTIIYMMGPTGTGKSSFIDRVTGLPNQFAGHRLESQTQVVQAVRIIDHPRYDGEIVLVDTPGFDDTNMSDVYVLTMISKWLEETERRGVRKLGLLYFHRITDNRMAGSPLKTLTMFGKICGDQAAERAILVTTMWDKVRDGRTKMAESRERELKTRFWKELLAYGANTLRFDNTPECAMRILDAVVAKARSNSKLLLQEELVDHRLYLSETQAGQTLYTTLQTILASQMETLRQLAEQNKSGNPEFSVDLRREYERVKQDLDRTFSEMKRMQIPFARKVALFFRRKTKANPINFR